MFKKLAITAFALSMSAAFANTEASNPQDNLNKKNKAATAAENAPAGYADKSAAAEPMVGQKDTQKAAKKVKKDAKMATSDRAPSGDTPAGYADKSTTDKMAKGEQKDTLKAQQQPDAGLGSMAAAPVKSDAPAGYADQSSAAKGSQQQDTQKAQSK